ncbi:MAG: type II toxin-antitoxin system Phd/YefM family antitoxin [Acidimicrobiia bacterium]|nr:type II toxin-antitoxin system Phd/YefM family antitoxin [Acidimicrobiia bacterium]
MPIKTLSSREFNQQASEAKKAAKRGPVFITERGKPAHVLLSIEAYRRLTGTGVSLAEAVADRSAAGAQVDLEIPRLDGFFRTPESL